LTSLDVVGHEIAHGLTEFSARLIYANESGALNESFSDIFGTALEFEARPNRANWTVGEDIGGAFRSMINPKAYGNPDTYGGKYWVNQNCIPSRANDYCGVHSNSGVQNRWFYLVAQGDTGVNDQADSFQVSGIGMTKAAEISFRNLTVYLTPSSNHEDARFYSIVFLD
jgi:Zn-dependent metalloprotease